MAYDPDNIFAKILRGEIPNRTVFEDQHVLAFHDINPQAPVHVLVIPKGPYENMTVFGNEASAEEQAALMRAIGEVVRIMELAEAGYRIISNNGQDGVQEVPHLHIHVLGGRRLGRMLGRPTA
ncbi:MAG: histidine triad nucleotide-binding protein [Proteobacteria bacterium]|nr:histidine triad nucleotide-binding protein [Pseudomonadota bacterium]MDA1308033.1 histidine triad nucleotide-binding protein [Pseudomonadota bacterium]